MSGSPASSGCTWAGSALATSRRGLLLGFLLAVVAGVVLMVVTDSGLMARLPFAPFLGAGAVLVVLWGAPLTRAWSG